MRKITVIIIILMMIVCVVPTVFSQEGNEALVHVTAIVASKDSESIDPELQEVADEMKTLFSFSSFRTLHTYTVLLAEGARDRVIINEYPNLIVQFIQQEENAFLFNVTMGDELDTDFSISNGGHILIGGPAREDGVLVLLFEIRE